MIQKFFVDGDKKSGYLEYVENNYKDKSTELFEKVMLRLDYFEMFRGKSIEKFKKNDLIELFKSMNSCSKSTLYTCRSTINSYLDYLNNPNDIKSELSKVNLDDCINTDREGVQYITEPEYYEILKDKGNYQYKAVVVLLWNKIKGLQLNEIINLKYEDLDVENKRIRIYGENPRTVQITQYEMDILEKAYQENIYKKIIIGRNGIQHTSERTLKKGDYLIKSTIGPNSKDININKIIYNTLKNRLTDYYNSTLKRKELKSGNIYKSSIYFDIIKEYGEPLKYSALKKITNKNKFKLSLSSAFREQGLMLINMKKRGLLTEDNNSNGLYNAYTDSLDDIMGSLDLDIDNSIENISFEDIDFIENLNPNIYIYNNSFNSITKKINSNNENDKEKVKS